MKLSKNIIAYACGKSYNQQKICVALHSILHHVAYIVWCVYIKLDIHCNTLHVQCEEVFRNILQFSWLRKRFEGLESLSLQTCIQVLYLSSKPHDSFLVEKVACVIAIRKAKCLEVVNEHLLYDSEVLLGIQFLMPLFSPVTFQRCSDTDTSY